MAQIGSKRRVLVVQSLNLVPGAVPLLLGPVCLCRPTSLDSSGSGVHWPPSMTSNGASSRASHDLQRRTIARDTTEYR
jgi:hypothetical protein